MKDAHAHTPVLILADDFTGANDAGMGLVLRGRSAGVVFATRCLPACEALVVDTESRALPAEQAEQAVFDAVRGVLSHQQPAWIVKKTDSTLRGNPGAELAALLKASEAQIVLFAPALPRLGRTTINGQCLVAGVPLDQTEFASDPKTPVISADIRELLQHQVALNCQNIGLEHIRQDYLGAQLQALVARGVQVAILDAEQEQDLDAIITAAMTLTPRPVLAGSAGICEALARRLPMVVALAHRNVNTGPLLAVVGSMSEIAQQQIARVVAEPGVVQVGIDVATIFSAQAADILTGTAQRVIATLKAGKHCVVSTTPDHGARHQVAALCQQRGLTRSELGERICQFLGELTRLVLEQYPSGGLYLSGGDVAMAVATAMGASGFSISGHIAECVPWGYFVGSEYQRPVMTKAGGFGTTDTLLEVVHFIEEKQSD